MTQLISANELYQIIWPVGVFYLMLRAVFFLAIMSIIILIKVLIPFIHSTSNGSHDRSSQFETIDIKVHNILMGISKPFSIKRVY